jgi:beta-glucosidase
MSAGLSSPSTRVDELVASLSLEEKCSLTSGLGMWSTKPVERLGIPAVRLTDGPNGARGPVGTMEGTLTSACMPCATSLASTWDEDLVEEVATAIGEEALAKGSRVLLAPTVNLHRHPLAGRNFECYSEDPLLSGKMAAAFIRGAQSRDVVCTVKHFVGNEAETERATSSSEIDERTLRELYLTPFEIAVREGGVLGVMTSYNRLNGRWLTEHEVTRDVLRGEWGFEGLVVTDWGGVGSSTSSPGIGIDLEMPGPGAFYGEHLLAAVQRGDVTVDEVDGCVRRLLTVLDRVGALDEEPAEPRCEDRPEHRAIARRAATAGTVLLRNDGVLPLDPSTIVSIAVIGPNAADPTLTGGGASNFKPHRCVTPLDAIRSRFPDASVRFEPGADRNGPPSPLRTSMRARIAAHATGDVLSDVVYPDAQVAFPGPMPGTDGGPFHLSADGRISIAEAGLYTFGLVQGTPSVLSIDGAIVLDGSDSPPIATGQFFFAPRYVDVELGVGEHEITVTSSGDTFDPTVTPVSGFTLGFRPAVRDDAIERAVAAATDADVAIVVVGTDSRWETEFRDRPHMDLRGRQDELVERVCAANPRTIVVVNAGAPVTMPWADRAPALLQAWFAGQEIGDALVDVLIGDAEPGGRLPTTFPLRVEHSPAFGTFPGENGVLRYGEGPFVGYRWYTSRHLPVRFPFGHGLSYTTFELGVPTVAGDVDDMSVTVPITNTGARRGSEVVQVYVSPPRSLRPRPSMELRAFAKVALDPGASTEVVLHLDRRAFSRWDPALPDHAELRTRLEAQHPGVQQPSGPETGGWVVDAGTYQLAIGRSCEDIAHRVTVDVPGS